MKARYFRKSLIVLLMVLMGGVQGLIAQEKPYWVEHLNIGDPQKFYFGIGVSMESREHADDDARVEFSKMIEVQVKNETEYQLRETTDELKDEYNIQTEVVTNMKLKGISITERYYDESSNTYYSLIRYEKNMYDKIMEDEIRREIERLSQLNQAREVQEAETQRHAQEMERLRQQEEKARLKQQAENERLEQEKKIRRQQHEQHLLRTRQVFLDLPAPHKMIDLPTGVMAMNTHEISVKPTIAPLGFNQANYSFFYNIVQFNAGVYVVEEEVRLQDASLALQLLKTDGKIMRFHLALGAAQYASNLTGKADLGYTVTLAAHASLSEFYMHTSLYAERRKVAFSVAYYPFTEQMNGKLSLLVQNEWIFDPDFRNRFGDRWLIEPGLRFAVIPQMFSSMISYEKNEFVVLTFDLSF